MFGVAVGPGVHTFMNYAVPLAKRIIDVVADRMCPVRSEGGPKKVPSLAETFDDLDAVSAAVTLEGLRHRKPETGGRDRPEWVPQDLSPEAPLRPTTTDVVDAGPADSLEDDSSPEDANDNVGHSSQPHSPSDHS